MFGSPADSGAAPRSPAHKHILIYAAAAVLGTSLAGYAAHEHHAARQLAARNAQSAAELKQTKNEIADLTAKVNMLVTAQEKPSPAMPLEQPARTAAARHASARRTMARAHRPDPYKKLQAELDAQGKAIDQTRSELAGAEGDLANTRTQLTGSIARNHGELVVLEKKGERNYAEFDLTKSKQYQRSGPFEIRLRKANVKHQYADLELIVDDRSLQQKHVNLYQPVMFSTPDDPQPVEVVINAIDKNHIHGYVSAPKYRQSELAAMTNSAQAGDGSQANSAAPAARKRLTLPQ